MEQVQNVADWWRNKIHPDDRPAVLAKIDKALETGAHRFQMEYRFQAADGSYKYIYDRAFVVTDENDKPLRVIGAMQDITERKKAELELVESLAEKETLLQEIHHRVKNNLAVVSGMMQLQAFEEEDENLREKLTDSMGRIKTMASIHELLYQSESFSKVEADKNIKKLVTEIVHAFQTDIQLDLHFDLQNISLNINQAILFLLSSMKL